MNVYFATLGCRLNEAEIALWQRELQKLGDVVVDTPEKANVVVVNTCAVTEEAARKSRKLTKRLRRLNPDASIALTGCFATLEPEKAAAISGVDFVFKNNQKNKLVESLRSEVGAQFSAKPLSELLTVVSRDGSGASGEQRATATGKTRAFIKVQDGCRNRCTFCIVTIARGNESSVSVSSIVSHVNSLVEEGCREVVLTGVHLGGYGVDLGTSLVELVKSILEQTSIERLRLSSLEPWDLPNDFSTLWQNSRLMPHLHLPLQSGCDSVLKRMARRCPTKKYADLVANIREAVSDITITTDLIVGFPGETEDEHRRSMDFVSSMDFAHMHVFPFSKREGTTAARMAGDLEKSVKRDRCADAIAIGETMRTRELDNFLGQRRPVLFEQESEISEGLWRYTGYTDNYLRTYVESSKRLSIVGSVHDVALLAHSQRQLEGALTILPVSSQFPPKASYLSAASSAQRP